MFDRIAALWDGLAASEDSDQASGFDDVALAAAVLMVEVARMDDTIEPAERDRIAELIGWRFKLNEAEAASLVARAETVTEGPAPWHRFTSTLHQGLDARQRLELVAMLWDIVYTDGHLHHLEANLMRRVAALLDISDADSGAARRRARERHGLSGDETAP